MKAQSRNQRTVMAVILWITTLILTSTANGQTAERYVTLDFNRALAHVFDATTNTEVAAITVGNGPNSIVISPNGRIAFVSNFFSGYVSVIDLTIGAEIKRIRNVVVSQLAISADGATVVGTDRTDDGITVIDANTLSIIRTISFNGQLGDDPTVDGDAFASNPVLAGNKVYLETGFDFGVIDLGTGIVTDLGSTPGSNFLPLASDVSAVTADGKFVIISRNGAWVIINTTTNVVRSIPADFAFAVSASRNAGNASQIYGYILRFAGDGTIHFSVVDLSAGSPAFGAIIGDLQLPPTFPLDLIAHIAPNSDGTRALLTTHAVKPNVYIVDTSKPFVPALVGSPISVNTDIRDVASGITQNQPPATAPVVAAVSAPLVVNSAATPLQILGSGFTSDAQVKIGQMDPQAAQFISSSLLQILVPADAPAANASIIVTNPDLSQGAAAADQSGILRNAFVIASGPEFQPANEVAIVNAGDATMSVLNTGLDPRQTPAFSASDRIVAVAITPDGSRAYVERTFAPATVDVFNFTTKSFEASIRLNASPAGQPGQTRGIVIAPRFSTGKPAAYVASSARIAPGRFSLNLYGIDADPASATFNTVVATLPTGEPNASTSSGGIAVTPDGHFAFVNGFRTDGTGDLVILNLASGASTIIPMGTLGVSAAQFGLELSPDGRFLVLLADDGSAHVFDVSNPATPVAFATIHGTPPAGFSPLFLRPRIIGNTMYTFDSVQNVVAIFNFNPAGNDFSQLATFAFSATPSPFFAVVFDVTPDGKLMYLPLREQDSVAVVDTARVLAGDPSALLTEIGVGISPHLATVRPATAVATVTRYTGDTTQNDHDLTNLSATLVVQGTSVPIPGETITFTLGTQSCTGTTSISGVAACSITLNQVPGSYTVKAGFAGAASHQASSDSRGFTITSEETTTTYTGPAVITNGANTTFSAVLKEDGNAAIAGRTITITLGTDGTAQTCNGVTNATGTVSCSILVNQPLGPGTVAANFAGDALYQPSSSGAATIVLAIATTTRYTGETTQNYHDVTNLAATLVAQGTSVPIPGERITFTLGTQSCTGITGISGVATCSILLNQVPGSYTVAASFAGSANGQASSNSTGFTITREETATTYTGPAVIANGASTMFSAVLQEDAVTAIAGRAIMIALGSGSTAQTCTGITDAGGAVRCSIVVNQPLGPGTVAATFAGDTLYQPSVSGAATILFAFPAQGAFVVGDQTASGTVEFWGDDWSTVNILTGGPAPGAFKGFANGTSEPPACGISWIANPGNSSQPPASPLPGFMGVIVSTKITQSGSTISGDTSRIIVVTTNPGYAPDPVDHGTATVVATFCTTGSPTSGSTP